MEIDGENNGDDLYRNALGPLRPVPASHPGMRKARRKIMNWIDILAGIAALGLVFYLFVALLQPEKF